jgi:peroxisomal membrane protein 4
MDASALLTAVKGAAHGLTYGTKIRLPHAFVMTFLFKPDLPAAQKLRTIATLAFLHARNLALFVGLYKALLALGRAQAAAAISLAARRPRSLVRASESADTVVAGALTPSLRAALRGPALAPPGRPAASWHPLVAGALGGWLVWGNYSGVNYQIVLYLLSRILVGGARVAAKRGVWPFRALSFRQSYPWGAAAVWALVMWLFEAHPDALDGSLRRSMDFLYRDADKGKRPADFLPSRAAAAVVATMVWLKRGNLGDLLRLGGRL